MEYKDLINKDCLMLFKKYIMKQAGQLKRIVVSGASATLEPNTLYIFPEPLDRIDIFLEPNNNPTMAYSYHFMFQTPKNKPTALALPSELIVPNTLKIQPNCKYHFSVLEGMVSFEEWKLP